MELMVVKPDIAYTKAEVQCNFIKTDAWLDELEKRYKTLVVNANDLNERKAAKEICANLNKAKKELEAEGNKTKNEIFADVKTYEQELKKRLDRIADIRQPLWEQVKPQKKEKKEPVKVGVPIKVCYLFEGDSNYISDMIGAAIFNDIKVRRVNLWQPERSKA